MKIMMKRQLILLFVSLLGFASLLKAEQPNILFLFADDQCFETIREFGYTDIDTPNLDRLVKGGTTFTHAYNMGSWSGAVCVASRTMLVTGRSVWRANAIYNETEKEREAGRLWPQMMSRAGYETYFTGKWHVRAKAELTFDVVKDVRAGMPKDSPAGYNRPLAGQPDPWSPFDPAFGGYWEGGKHWSEVVGDNAVEFLGVAAKKENPFFMYIAFNSPHDPRQSPKEYVDKYPLDRITLPENFLPKYPYKDDIGCGVDLRDEKLAPFPRTEESVKVHRQEYYAIITHMDAQIGRILKALDQSGKAENTWIFFTADHGLAVGHHGLMGKQNMYDDSVRVPFLVNGPGVAAGAKIDSPIYLQDVMATSLELAGAPKEAQVEFQSLLPLLAGKESPAARETIYGAYLALQRSVTRDGWKLILYPKAKVARLYDLTVDPGEMTDLASDPANTEKKKILFQQFLELQKELADPLEIASVFPDLQ